MKKILIGLLTAVLLGAGVCWYVWQNISHEYTPHMSTIDVIVDKLTPSTTTQVFVIGPQRMPCTGVGEWVCLVVNGEYFYDRIDGFDFVSGYTTTALVERRRVFADDNIPADGSAFVYSLQEIISQVKE